MGATGLTILISQEGKILQQLATTAGTNPDIRTEMCGCLNHTPLSYRQQKTSCVASLHVHSTKPVNQITTLVGHN